MVTKSWTWAFLAMSLASCRCDGGGSAQKPPETRATEEDARAQAVVAKENAEQAVLIKQLENDLANKKAELQAAEDSAKQARNGADKAMRLTQAGELRKKVADLQARIDAIRAGDASAAQQ